MDKLNSYSRKDFLKFMTIAAIGGPQVVSLARSQYDDDASDEELKVFIFSKHLQFLNYKDMSEAAKEMGFDGIDLTVRPKGHVLPERVAEDLPRATEAMRSFGLLPQMVTTKVLDADDKIDRNVLEVISKMGYKYYRTGWYKFTKDEEIIVSFKKFKENLNALAELNRVLGITGGYQNHSGHYLGSSIWELDRALEGLSKGDMGSQYDIMHANVEGGKNWEIGFRLIKDHINTLVVKDFKWVKEKGKWRTMNTPLGEGMVDFKKYFSMLKKYKIKVPISIHCEYDLGGAEHGKKPSIGGQEVLKRIKKDLIYLRESYKNA